MQFEQLSLLQNILKLTKEKYAQQQIKSEIGTGVKFDLLQFEGNLYMTVQQNITRTKSVNAIKILT